MKDLDDGLIIAELIKQFRRVDEKQYLSLLSESSSHLIVQFKPTVKPITVKIVLRHIDQKYGKHVWIIPTQNDPHRFEIWDKKIAF